jgi:hypothetical protein
MSAEQNLESAGANLRAASASMPFPQMRVRKPIRQGFVAFAAGLAVALMIGVPLYLTRTSPPDGAPVAAPDETTTTGSLGTTTTSVPPTTTTTESAAPACGTELPYQVTLPEDFIGPIAGPAPHAPHPAEDGQLAIHWLGRDGSVEIRWPADQEYLEGAVWGEPAYDRSQNPDSPMFIGPPVPDIDGVERPIVTDVLPTEDMSGPCDGAQLVVYSPAVDGGNAELLGAGFGAEGQEGLAIYPDLARPRDKVLIVETIATGTIPEVLACDGGPGVDFVPRKTGTTPNGPIFGTPEEAFQDLLDTDVAESWPNVGYFELVAPDGTLTYGNPLDDNSPDPRPDNGLVISVTVIEVEGGWTVTEWEASGC